MIEAYAFEMTGISEFVAPPCLWVISHGVFHKCDNLRQVILIEGLEILGASESPDEDRECYGVFEGTLIEEVKLPSTLKKIGNNSFLRCENLRWLSSRDVLSVAENSCS